MNGRDNGGPSAIWATWSLDRLFIVDELANAKERKQVEKEAKEALQYHQEQIVRKLIDQEHMLNRAVEKIDHGLQQMREKYAEDRLLRMKDK